MKVYYPVWINEITRRTINVRSELFIEYMRLKKEMAVVVVEPVFLQGISRENGSAIIRTASRQTKGTS